jgi:hypothetical protein
LPCGEEKSQAVTEKPPSEPEHGTAEWAEWASLIYREYPEEWKRFRKRQRAEARRVLGPLRFIAMPIIWAMAARKMVSDKVRRGGAPGG